MKVAVASACMAGFVLMFGCSASTPVAAVRLDAGSAQADASMAIADGGSVDAAGALCEGACKTLSLTLSLQGKMVTFDRAQFGGSVDHPYIELYKGGSPECPKPGAPNPDYTLILSFAPNASDGGSGNRANFFDFKGDIIGAKPVEKGLSLSASMVQGIDKNFVALDALATFAGGKAEGHVYASYCPSLD
jgi:hypothetical protein